MRNNLPSLPTVAALGLLAAVPAHAATTFSFEGSTDLLSNPSEPNPDNWVWESWDEVGSFEMFAGGPLELSLKGGEGFYGRTSGSTTALAQPDDDEGFSMSLRQKAFAASYYGGSVQTDTLTTIDFTTTRHQTLSIDATILNFYSQAFPGRGGSWTIRLIGDSGTLYLLNKQTNDPEVYQIDESIKLLDGTYRLTIEVNARGVYESGQGDLRFDANILLTPTPASALAFAPFMACWRRRPERRGDSNGG